MRQSLFSMVGDADLYERITRYVQESYLILWGIFAVLCIIFGYFVIIGILWAIEKYKDSQFAYDRASNRAHKNRRRKVVAREAVYAAERHMYENYDVHEIQRIVEDAIALLYPWPEDREDPRDMVLQMLLRARYKAEKGEVIMYGDLNDS
ncbi:MAG: hypothetical protein FWG40_00535 [Peptococcaceae bacterium]|nr:hypothetical protein [Peptococcaceae bacterium]